MNAAIDVSDTILRTERLVLRPWRRSDLDDFFEYASVPGTGEMAGWGHHRSIEDSEAILQRFIEKKRTFAIEYRGPGHLQPGKVIGSLGIEEYREKYYPELADKKARELGFVLSKDYWGLGIMPEAVNAVLHWLFSDIGLDAVTCSHFIRNRQSARVQEKCGFRHHSFGEYFTQTGTIEKDEHRIMTAEDYRMQIKPLSTGSISYLELLDADDNLYWGTDHASGDLYEAGELYDSGRGIRSNRLIFVSLKDGKVSEPLPAGDGQYFGKPVMWEGRAYFLLVDFKARRIFIYRCSEDLSSAEVFVQLSLDEVPDCYNLMLDTAPLILTRQGPDKVFQVVWPDKCEFVLDDTETFDCRDGDVLIFSRWFEDPDYREDTVLRRYPGGEVIETLSGPLMVMKDGKKWLLERSASGCEGTAEGKDAR